MIFNNLHYIATKLTDLDKDRDIMVPVYVLVDKVIYDYLIEVNGFDVENPRNNEVNFNLNWFNDVIIDYSKFKNNHLEIKPGDYAVSFGKYFYTKNGTKSKIDDTTTFHENPDLLGYYFASVDFRKSNFNDVEYNQVILDFKK